MGKRLSGITTGLGDRGTTGLGDGSRVSKDDARIHALGTLDELNAAIGLALTESLPAPLASILVEVQHDLFELGGELCIPGYENLPAERISWLEGMIGKLNADLPSLEEFILPGGTRAAALVHLARTIARRAERLTISLVQRKAIRTELLVYLNRLSDLLFVLARTINQAAGCRDVMWNRKRNPHYDGNTDKSPQG